MAANWANRTLFHGDNLGFLRAMNSESVDLIATDPPFNKGRDFHATPDSLAAGARFQDRWSWERDVHESWTDQITDDHPRLMEAIESARYAHSDGMGAYMCFMAVRLLAMHRVLKPTGSIYLHCDPTASHYLKAVMDAIFGCENFRSEIIWKRTGSHGGASRWGPIHDTILFSAKSRKQTWNRTFQPYSEDYLRSHYNHKDKRGRYQPVSLTGTGTRTGESGQPWRGIDPTAVGRHWAVPSAALQTAFPDRDVDGLTTQQRLDLLDEAGLIHWPPKGRVPRQKRYAHENPGVPLQDIVTDINPAGGGAQGLPDAKALGAL
ncbi:MAG: site-specific DNA-methyltransferase [Rhodospirillaceae bacterium]|nr:site-specific DNA-methyltransferase [Rhodospirillaceae bacterium]